MSERWLLAALTRPRHVGLAFFASGLAASEWLPVTLATLIAGGLFAGVGLQMRPYDRFEGPHPSRMTTWVVVAACLPLGALLGQQRTVALERTTLAIGQPARGNATLLELPRTDKGGRISAVIKYRGERVLLRPPPWNPRINADIGEILNVSGELKPPDLVAGARKAHATFLASTIKQTGRRRGGLAGAIDATRSRAQRALSQGLPPPQAGLFRGMVLGQDAALPRDLNDDFRASGLSHLVAASGANIALLATLALGAAALTGIPVRPRLIAVIALIALYVPLAGGGPSIQRAGIMGAAAIVALLASRPSDRWYALLLAACGTLLLDPRSIGDPGWQMSFAAVLALLALARPLVNRMTIPRPLAEATAVTVLATLATAPIAAAHFGTTSLASLPANVLAAPVVAPIMWLGFLAAALGQFAPLLAAPFAWVAAPLIGYLTWLGSSAAQWPGAGVAVDWALVTVTSAGGLLVIGYWLSRPSLGRSWVNRQRIVIGATLVVALLLVAAQSTRAPAPPPPGTLRVTALDVGQGDAILVQGGGASVLFDAGVPEAPTVKRLKETGVNRLDAFVITHRDNDHAGGAPEVLRRIKVGMLIDGRGTAPLPEPGQEIALGRLTLKMLWPTAEARTSGAPTNDRATVMEAEVGGRKALLTADAESEILTTLDLHDIDILKVAHHGSNDDLLPELLARTTPEVALISVGRNNDYGHPTAKTLRMLNGIEVHRTDLEGTVSADASPAGISVRRSR